MGGGATWGVVPGGQADGFFKEAQLWVVKPKRLIDHVRRRLHVHLQDGDGVVVFVFKCDLQEEVQRLERRRGKEPRGRWAEPRRRVLLRGLSLATGPEGEGADVTLYLLNIYFYITSLLLHKCV